jgi:DUF4097 and DUF4098 domain-containing protein YvlB
MTGIGTIAVLAVWCWVDAGGARSGLQANSSEAASRLNTLEAKGSQGWILPREGASNLYVRTPSGAIRTAAAEEDQIRIQATKEVRGPSEAEAQVFLGQMRIERRREGDRWIVEATWPEWVPSGIQSAQASFEISLPRGMRLEAQSGNGAVEATGVAGATLRTDSGDLRARDVAGRLDAHTGNGSIEIGRCAGPMEVDSSSGGVTIRQAQNSVTAKAGNGPIRIEACVGPVEAASASGAITILRVPGTVTAATGNGGIEVKGVKEARLRTDSGDIRAGDIAGRLDAHTGNGAVEVDHCGGPVEVDTSSGGIAIRQAQRAVKAKTGNGPIQIEGCAGSVEAKSSSGWIKIRQARSRVDATTGNGSIEVELVHGNGAVHMDLTGTSGTDLLLPENVSALIEVGNHSGSFEFDLPGVGPIRRGPAHVEAVLGHGEGSFHVRTSESAIRIRKAVAG